MKQPTLSDLYHADFYMSTQGVASALLEGADATDKRYEFNDHGDGQESVFYESEAGLRYFLGTRDAPMPEVQVAAGPSPVTSDAGAAFGMYPPAIVKRQPNTGLEPSMNPFARVISKGANWLADQVDKGATLYDTMQLIIPGGFDPNTKITVPTDFKPTAKQINPATGEQKPATLNLNPVEVTIGDLLKSTPVSEVIGLRGVARIAESLGTGNLPDMWDVLDAAGLMPAGTGTAGVIEAAVGTAKKAGKALAPKVGEMAINSMEKLGTPVQMNIVPPSPSTAGKPTKAMAPASDLGFYSAVEKSALNLQRNSGTGQAFLNDILKGENVKADEIKWMGLDDFLKGKKNVTKQEIQDFVQSNRVDVQEVTLGAPTESPAIATKRERFQELMDKMEKEDGLLPEDMAEADKLQQELSAYPNPWLSNKEAKYEKYQLPGGDNYRELLLKLPPTENVVEQWMVYRPNGASIGGYASEEYAKKAAKEVGGTYKQGKSLTGETGYRSSHWNDLNVLAHLRVNDRVDADGKKMLLIEEVQSDWHQAGREKGYKGSPTKEAIQAGTEQAKNMGYKQSEIDNMSSEQLAHFTGAYSNAVPDAPFKDTWYQLALKRALKYASDNGYERVGLTTGKQQAERYDLSKQVDNISYEPTDKGFYINIISKDGENVLNGDYSVKDLEGVVGKEITQKMVSKEGKNEFDPKVEPDLTEVRRLEGVDLKVGGEGMKKYYDDVYPKFLEKYGKKWNASVGETRIKTGRGVQGGEPVRYIDITPEMRKSVQKGQPLSAISSENTLA